MDVPDLKNNQRRADGGRFGYNLEEATRTLYLFDNENSRYRTLSGREAETAHRSLEDLTAKHIDGSVGGGLVDGGRGIGWFTQAADPTSATAITA